MAARCVTHGCMTSYREVGCGDGARQSAQGIEHVVHVAAPLDLVRHRAGHRCKARASGARRVLEGRASACGVVGRGGPGGRAVSGRGRWWWRTTGILCSFMMVTGMLSLSGFDSGSRGQRTKPTCVTSTNFVAMVRSACFGIANTSSPSSSTSFSSRRWKPGALAGSRSSFLKSWIHLSGSQSPCSLAGMKPSSRSVIFLPVPKATLFMARSVTCPPRYLIGRGHVIRPGGK